MPTRQLNSHYPYPYPAPTSDWPRPPSNWSSSSINMGWIPASPHSHFTTCWRWNRHSVPKRRLLLLRCRGNTQKTIHHIYYLFNCALYYFLTLLFCLIFTSLLLLACRWLVSCRCPPQNVLYGTVSVWHLSVWHCIYMALYLYGTVSVWYCICICMVLYLYGTVSMALYLYGTVSVWHCICMVLYLYGTVSVWYCICKCTVSVNVLPNTIRRHRSSL